MLQLVHDVAPGAKLGFATAFIGEVQFSNNILSLRRSFHADVIVDDVIYFDEPMFSDGLLAQTVDKVVSEGAAYFSSAGNNGLEAYQANYDRRLDRQGEAAGRRRARRTSTSTRWRRTGSRPRASTTSATLTAAPASRQRFTSYFGDVVDFQWDEPFDLGKVKTDYNIYVFDADGHFIDPNDPTSDAFFTSDDNTATDQALELMAVNPGTYQIVIAKVNDGPARRHQVRHRQRHRRERDSERAVGVGPHRGAPRPVGGARCTTASPSFPEDFSSPGPVTIYFDKRGRRLDEPEVRDVPQITAVDGADTTFFIPGLRHRRQRPSELLRHQRRRARRRRRRRAGDPVGRRPRPHRARRCLRASAARRRRRYRCRRNRTLAAAFAGPVVAAANGDFPRETNYWTLAVEPFTQQDRQERHHQPDERRTCTFPIPPSPTTGFHIGTLHGLARRRRHRVAQRRPARR